MRSLGQLAQRAAEYPKLYAAAYEARRRIRALPEDMPRSEVLDFARDYAWFGGRLRPTQATDEILWLLDKVEALDAKTIVEVGTDEGGTLFLWTWVAAPDAQLVAVDARPLGVLGQMSAYAIVRRGLARERQRIEIVMPVNSQIQETVDRVSRMIGGRPVDFLFIDGDHSYEGVKRDFELWSPLVRSGGLVAFHDMRPDHPDGVPRLWAELRERYETEERIASTEPNYGIGVVHIP